MIDIIMITTRDGRVALRVDTDGQIIQHDPVALREMAAGIEPALTGAAKLP
jgi:hypothetical protein